ncbi:phosphoenolpyruvate synthase [Candidatus Woesebacteria bacterium RBG_16_36_11]|uniref:Phosphoenolpyruvate synthase n=2 Tax=Candidatus Woeseibacteriota TaxID=1752722 RepID=A0A1F7XAY7_9BACT|nr:MAG: phosphoenolpyruvate synthase [Candidatus Woesebacteria bacterium RBG_16_36_11]OGM16514.1 MAG: phosphoenolpyruvate synthase [Candidatus Woesebacteria bacterium RBG_19FT_COMBO_37_29]
MSAKPLILPFKEINKEDTEIVGGKGANLGEMVNSGFPVPQGFAITIYAYDIFLKENNLLKSIYDILKITDVNDPQQLRTASTKIRSLLMKGKISKDIFSEVAKSYKKLSGTFSNALVAVRSSATAEDMPGASFAGQQITYLNVKGESTLIEAVRKCWASLFTERSIFYRVQNKIPHEKVKISVIVQKMISSEVSGVIFTIDPVTNEKDKIIVEAIWGLGELIVQGSVVPDKYVIQKETFAILSKEISSQKVMLVRGKNGVKEVAVPKKLIDRQKIKDEEIIWLGKIANKLQDHYYFPQDIEWAKEKNKIYIVQTRPVTTIQKEVINKKTNELTKSVAPILTGTSASPGIGTGPVKIVKDAKEISKIHAGDVLVSVMTSPDFVPAMKKACAIVTDKGGLTSHAAIVSRELGVPCVVGTNDATTKLEEGMVVSVDGTRGLVFLGNKIKLDIKKEVKEKEYKRKTATRVYLNLAEPERVLELSKLNVDGVGLLRAEFMIANIGIHPKEAIKMKKQDDYVLKLAKDIARFCSAFYPRPVVYRATDFKTNEYRILKGGKAWEPEESNPMLGFRGAFRYIATPEVFALELKAIKLVRKKYNNLWLMVPYVRSPEELTRVRRIVAAEDLFESPTFKFWMMVELPVNVIMFDDFVKVGIDGVSIGSNDLTMLLTGTDRDNEEVAKAFDENSDVVSWSLKRIIHKCQKFGISSSICGQAPSTYDEMVRKLVRYGITSISVNPDAINRVRKIIAETEDNL